MKVGCALFPRLSRPTVSTATDEVAGACCVPQGCACRNLLPFVYRRGSRRVGRRLCPPRLQVNLQVGTAGLRMSW